MNIDLLRLKNNVDKVIEINETLTFTKEQLENTDLLDLKDVLATGELTKDSMNEAIKPQIQVDTLPITLSGSDDGFMLGFMLGMSIW